MIKYPFALSHWKGSLLNQCSLQLVDDETGKRAMKELQTPQMKSCRASNPTAPDAVTKTGRVYPSWHRPSNWGSAEFAATDDQSPQPHLHRVPCRHDEVVFPKGRE